MCTCKFYHVSYRNVIFRLHTFTASSSLICKIIHKYQRASFTIIDLSRNIGIIRSFYASAIISIHGYITSAVIVSCSGSCWKPRHIFAPTHWQWSRSRILACCTGAARVGDLESRTVEQSFEWWTKAAKSATARRGAIVTKEWTGWRREKGENHVEGTREGWSARCTRRGFYGETSKTNAARVCALVRDALLSPIRSLFLRVFTNAAENTHVRRGCLSGAVWIRNASLHRNVERACARAGTSTPFYGDSTFIR